MITFLAYKWGGGLADRDKIEPGTMWLLTGFGFLIDVALLVFLIAYLRWGLPA